MSTFTDNEFWDLRARGSAVDFFVASSFHLLRTTSSLDQAEARSLRGEVHVLLLGVAVMLVSIAREECVGDDPRTIEFFEFSPDGFGVKIDVTEDRFPAEFLAAFAVDVTFARRVLRFRVSKPALDSMVSDWLARRPVAPPK